MAEKLDEKPFEHILNHGIKVRAARCDFIGGIDVSVPEGVTNEKLAAEMFSLGSWHWANIVPRLHGYSGPPEVRIHIRED